jgi:hypothetical protein
MNSSALIGGKFLLQKNPLQDLISSLKAVILTNESTHSITGHLIYNLAYTFKFQLKTTMVCYFGKIAAVTLTLSDTLISLLFNFQLLGGYWLGN